MNENEYLTVNDRYYVNPQLSVDESEQFLETLRNAQKQGNAQIAQETHALGTDVPSSMGGLSGSGGIWEQRYQNPRVDDAVAKLRASMQADALSKTMNNIMNQKQEEYKDAYRAAYKKQLSNSGGGGNNGGNEEEKLEINTNGGNNNTELSVNENQNIGPGFLVPTGDGTAAYEDENGGTVILKEIPKDDFNKTQLPSSDTLIKAQRPQHGDTKVIRGSTYRYIVNSQYPDGAWFIETSN